MQVLFLYRFSEIFVDTVNLLVNKLTGTEDARKIINTYIKGSFFNCNFNWWLISYKFYIFTQHLKHFHEWLKIVHSVNVSFSILYKFNIYSFSQISYIAYKLCYIQLQKCKIQTN